MTSIRGCGIPGRTTIDELREHVGDGARGCVSDHLLRVSPSGRAHQRVSRLRPGTISGRTRRGSLRDLPAGVAYRFVEADLLASVLLRPALQGLDAVVLLAALGRTTFAFDQPTGLIQANHWGTARLFEQCREGDVRRLYSGVASLPMGQARLSTRHRPVGRSVHIPDRSGRQRRRCRRLGP